MICKDKRWDIKAKCDRCDDDDVLCTQHGENCQEEYTVCEDGNILRKCEDNIIKIQLCQFKASCADGNNCNECGENATNCKDEKTLQSCVDNHWKETSCANGCDVENDKCKPEESQPSCQTGDEEQKECKPICTNNTECPDGQVCKDNDCVSKDDNDECSTDSCPNGQCENGECRVKNSNSCQNNNECPFNICEGNQCVECRKDTARCYNRFVEKCVDGKWKKMNPKPSVKHVKAVLNVLMTTKVVFNMSVMKMAFGI